MSEYKKYNKDYFKTWSSDMAYVLGFLYADGNIVETVRGNHYIAIYTADRDLLCAMQKSMLSEHKISLRNANSGNVWIGFVHKERKIPLKTIQVAFTSGSFAYLDSLHNELKKIGIIGGGLYTPESGNFTRLAFSVRDALKIYEIMYNGRHTLFLKRKKSIFEQFINLRS